MWAEYFAKSGDITVAFWSATAESGVEKKEEEEEKEEEGEDEEEEEEEEEESEDEEEDYMDVEEKEEEEKGEGGEKGEEEVMEEGRTDIFSSSLLQTPEQLCVARGNQQTTEGGRDVYAENLEQEKFPHGEDGDHKLDGSALVAKTVVSNEGDTTEAVTHEEVPTDNFTNEGHISDEENPAHNEEFIDEDPGGSLTSERDKYLTDGDVPTDSPANEGSPTQAGHIPSGNPGANSGARNLESGGGVDEEGVRVSPTSTRAKLLSREELVDLFMEISPVKGRTLPSHHLEYLITSNMQIQKGKAWGACAVMLGNMLGDLVQ